MDSTAAIAYIEQRLALAQNLSEYGHNTQEAQELEALLKAVSELTIKAARWDNLKYARETAEKAPDDCEWKRLARAGNPIEAIKACRSEIGCGLREAKDCVEGYLARPAQ